ncbi:hypothetical protein DSM26151_29350 [Agromyces marinus]|uniref:HEPN domain-containing protein n=2 Tax=Agromyces marinus TaxID=1389020 RepID=A0ABM8H245_9MICO|nr:hypothetical protein DSM26151_29350 [Agromyces marinus]BDZ54871.1 hypothetical protein GCM10025870_19440 [Agromyces marinus]
MPPRTRKMTRTEVRTRALHAHAFLTAAGDSICGAVLGERAAGQDHGDAVAMLRRTEPGKRLAQHLARLIDSKTETQYSPLLLTEARAADLLKAARRLVDGMDDVLRTLS